MKLDKNDYFFIKHEEKVNLLINARNSFISKLNAGIVSLLDITPLPSGCTKQWISAKSCLVHDFELSGKSIAFDIHISSTGWELTIFGRNIDSHAHLKKLLLISPMSNYKVSLKKHQYLIMKYELSTEPEIIKENLLRWCGILIETDKNLKLAT